MPSVNRRFTSPSAKSLALLSLLIVAFIVAACAAASGPGAAPGDGQNLGGGPVTGGTDEDGNGEQPGSLADQRIIKNGEIGIEVPDVTLALARVRAMAQDLEGYVGGSQAGTRDEAATLTLRIPADRFEDALARLHELDGDVVLEATNEQDVTSTVVDLDARIANLQASETQYRGLLSKAVKVEDILAVQTRLDDVRGQIEQLQARHKELSGLADLSTLNVTLIPSALQQAAGSWDPGKTVADAFAALVAVGQGVGNGAIWFVVVWLPALIVLGLIVLLLRRFVPGLRARMTRPPEA